MWNYVGQLITLTIHWNMPLVIHDDILVVVFYVDIDIDIDRYIHITHTCTHLHTHRHIDTHIHKYLPSHGFPSGILRQNWNDAEKISMAPAQGWHAHIEKCKQYIRRNRIPISRKPISFESKLRKHSTKKSDGALRKSTLYIKDPLRLKLRCSWIFVCGLSVPTISPTWNGIYTWVVDAW